MKWFSFVQVVAAPPSGSLIFLAAVRGFAKLLQGDGVPNKDSLDIVSVSPLKTSIFMIQPSILVMIS